MTNQEINEAIDKKLHGGKHPIRAMINDPIEGAPINMVACYGPIPNYCDDIKAAWEIVEWFRSKNMRFGLTNCPLGSDAGWECYVQSTEETFSADTAPMAIALAFLKVEI